MKMLLLVSLALASAASAQTEADAEIVVIARKVAQVGITLGRDAEGRTTCGLTRSSGDVRIDDAMCRRASRCMKPKMTAQAEIDACIAKQRKALVRAWAKGERT